MKKMLKTAMMTSISEVMETMFFLPVEFGQESSLEMCGMDKINKMACHLEFSGDTCGHMMLVVPEHLVAEMAENFMGEPSDNFAKEILSGTLAEMLNMSCGNALSKTDSKIPYELRIPEMVDESMIPKKEAFTIIETTESKMALLLKVD